MGNKRAKSAVGTLNNFTAPEKDKLILGENAYYSMDSYATQLNQNTMIVAASGVGKTTSQSGPNILQATGSYIITDAKGVLYNKYSKYLVSKGYQVDKLDFTDPMHSTCFNFFDYIKDEQDIVKIAHMIMWSDDDGFYTQDRFWQDAAELLLQACIGAVMYYQKNHRNLHEVIRLVEQCNIFEDNSDKECILDGIIEKLENSKGPNFATRQYRKFRIAAGRTLKSILITLNAKLGRFDTEAMKKLMSHDGVDLKTIGTKKRALFVVVSDTDRSNDTLANIFYTVAINTLCEEANRFKNNRLPVPVRMIFDDFATNVRIDGYPRIISSIRSRNISCMHMIQQISQLEACYGKDSDTIIGNCDYVVYMGGSDIGSAQYASYRANVPLNQMLNLPLGKEWIFVRGQEPKFVNRFDWMTFEQMKFEEAASNEEQKPEGSGYIDITDELPFM